MNLELGIKNFWKLVFGIWCLGFGVLFCYAQDVQNQQNAPQPQGQQPAQPSPQQPQQPLPFTDEQKAQIEKSRMDASLKYLIAVQQAKYANVDNYTAQFSYSMRGGYGPSRFSGEIFVSGVNSGGKLMWVEANPYRKNVEKKVYLNGGELTEFDLVKKEATRRDITKKIPYFVQVPLRSGFTPEIVECLELIHIDFAMEGETNASPIPIYNQRLQHKLIFTTSDNKLKRDIKLLEFWVNKNTFLIEHIELTHPNGMSVAVSLSDIKVNTDIPAEKFAVSLEGFRVK